jgi:hypothetical protein
MASDPAFTPCPENEDCVQYNIRTWTYGFIGIYLLYFLGVRERVLRWNAPLLMFFPYLAFRATEPFEALHVPGALLGYPCYALAMYWGHYCFGSRADQARDLGVLAAFLAALYSAAGVATLTLQDEPTLDWVVLCGQFCFVPGYVMSLRSLWRARADLWFAGLAFGWAGPLALLATVGADALYAPLSFMDLFVTFPLVFVGQLRWALRGDPQAQAVVAGAVSGGGSPPAGSEVAVAAAEQPGRRERRANDAPTIM